MLRRKRAHHSPRSGHNEAVKQAILAGLGISARSRHALSLNQPGPFAILDVEGFPILRHGYAVYLAGRQLSVVTQAFLDYLPGRAEAAPAAADKRKACKGCLRFADPRTGSAQSEFESRSRHSGKSGHWNRAFDALIAYTTGYARALCLCLEPAIQLWCRLSWLCHNLVAPAAFGFI